MMTTEEHQLVVRVLGQAEVERLKNEIEKEEHAIRSAKAALDANALSHADYAAALEKSTGAIVKHKAGVESLSAGFKNYNQNITAAGYAVNDFFSVSGNLDQRLNAIANNLPGVFAGFGGLGLALGAIVPILAVLVRNWDSLGEAFGGGGNKIPEAATALGRLGEALKDTGKEIDDLKKKQSLSNDELAKYNALSERQVELEKAKTEELKKQKELAAYKEIQPAAQTADEKAGAKGITSLISTDKENLEGTVTEGLRQGASSEYIRLQQLANRQNNGSEEQKATMAEMKRMKGRMGDDPAAFEANANEARELLARGAAGGKAEDLERINQLADQAGKGGTLGPVQREVLRRTTPAGVARTRAEAGEAKTREVEVDRAFKVQEGGADERRDAEKVRLKAAAEDKKAEDAKAAGLKQYVGMKVVEPKKTPEQQTRDAMLKAQDNQVRDVSRQITEQTGGALAGNHADMAAIRAVELGGRGVDSQSAMEQAVGEIRQMRADLARMQAKPGTRPQKPRTTEERVDRARELREQKARSRGRANAPKRRPQDNRGGFPSMPVNAPGKGGGRAPAAAGGGDQAAAAVPDLAGSLQQMGQAQGQMNMMLAGQIQAAMQVATAVARAVQGQGGMMRDQWQAQRVQGFGRG